MTVPQQSFDSGHTDTVHDVQLDFYGKRMASASSDRLVKIFDVAGEAHHHVADLAGHEGPVWQVSWAHPKFGNLLASCSFDHKVIIWQEVQEGVWTQVYQTPNTLHTASINSVCWAPSELGLMLACGSSDSTISIITHNTATGAWETTKIGADEPAHPIGVTSVSWAPAVPPGSLVSAQGPSEPVMRLVSCGCDNNVKIWTFNQQSGRWVQEGSSLAMHSDWVRDVAWAPNLGLPMNTIASAGQDGKAIVWTEKPGGSWEPVVLKDFGVPVWRVSWSTIGNILAISDANNAVTLWKEEVDGQWQCIS
mmetsp:Transcript_132/g.478  ORF Transcript_132/g.478 Transcript_132/m.478 type:complete len:307 (+) Transcript_132:228-1148(+)|eukprot:CAMPEP_0117679840 /NCGR_PEP_ID=MMETSP0804-20121206/18023_1 /TAXON_ID=1074897 /ORGANISM="Tetraselmis astigmatica, Strain CCMP880" /LENGTH=306 /DNA_ID=CAMNT_0005489277 /DNA_START=209 /DNA_END=1129 /DNA_ORIENTATION=-